MKTIEQRAEEYVPNTITAHIFKSSPLKGLIVRILRDAYIAGAKEQQAIDEKVRLKKSDDMTEAEYDRETAFADWYLKNGKGTPTYSDAIEWARKQTIDEACEIVRNIANEYFGDWEQSCKVEDTFRKTMEE